MDDTTLQNYYGNNYGSFTETFAIVKYKLSKNKPMMSAKEEMMDDFIKDWAELFGYDSVK